MSEDVKKEKRTFKKPDAFKLDPEKGYLVRDDENSEEFLLFETIGLPRVVYAVKENRYYKDLDCEKPYSDGDLQKMGLPLPIEIETERQKLIKEANNSGKLVSMKDIYRKTSPQPMDYPDQFKHLREIENPLARDIARLQRAVLGRKS